jgi:ribonuclease HI
MFFDGSSSNEGSRAGVVLVSPYKDIFTLSFKLEFQITNNIAEYKTLILGFRDANDLKIDKLEVFGDSESVGLQVRDKY